MRYKEKIQNWLLVAKLPLVLAVLLLIALSLAGFEQRLALINANLPYATHMDEGYLLEPAKHILEDNEFNPHVFTYPSLPIYLISIGMAAGLLDDVKNPAIVKNFNQSRDKTLIGRTYYPFYTLPNVVKGAKVLFAGLSVLVFFCIGLIAYKAFSHTALIFLPAFFLSLSGFYLHESWFYLNVDIIGAATCAFFYLCLFMNMDKDTYFKRAVIPGFAAGLVIASKYTLFPIILVTPLALLLGRSEAKGFKIIVAVGVCILSFILVSPYVLLDVSTFLRHAAGQVLHYQSGHEGHNLEPGWAHLIKNLGDLKNDYGWLIIILSVNGLGYAFYRHWRNTLIILSFPLLLLLYISMQKVSFVRNLTVLYALLPIFSAMGLLCVYRVLAYIMREYGHASMRSWQENLPIWLQRWPLFIHLLPILLILVLLPLDRFGAQGLQDSRNEAAIWIKQHVPMGVTLISAKSLGFDARMLNETPQSTHKNYSFGVIDFKKPSIQQLRQLLNKYKPVYILVPTYSGRLGPKGEKYELDDAARLNEKMNAVLVAAERLHVFGHQALRISAQYRPFWDESYIEMPAMTKQAKFSLYRY